MKKIICFLILIVTMHSLFSQDLLKSYLNREYSRYNTKGHSKSLGLNIVIDIPRIFIASEGKRPHIIQKWSYQIPNTQGAFIYLYLLVTDMNQDANKIWYMSPEKFSESALGMSYNVATSGLTKLDGIKASYAIGVKSELNELLGISIYQKSKMLNAVYDDKLIQILFTIAGANSSEVASYYNKYELLFNLIINSVAVQNQWNNKSI